MGAQELKTLAAEGKQILATPHTDPKTYVNDTYKRWSLKVYEHLRTWEVEEFGGGVVGGYISKAEMERRVALLPVLLERRACIRLYLNAPPWFKV